MYIFLHTDVQGTCDALTAYFDSGNVDGLLSLYTNDCILVSKGGIVKGKAGQFYGMETNLLRLIYFYNTEKRMR